MSVRTIPTRPLLFSAILVAVQGCAGIQSALDPAGSQAHRVAALTWLLTGICGAVLLIVCALTLVALYGPEPWRLRLSGEASVIGGGIVFPVVVLTGLLAVGFYVMGYGVTGARDGPFHVEVVGERWWWRVTYVTKDGRRTHSANEIRLPIGQPVEVHLTSADVVHSFWVPRLAGKLDMIPGRTNVQTLEVTEPGLSRGQCAEYCGGAHALMSLYVVGMPQPGFDAWFAREMEAGRQPSSDAAAKGQKLFISSGCGGCHTVRGTPANGSIGPDLTHVGNRHSLAAASLPNDRAAFARWIREGQHIKPENRMPPYAFFSDEEVFQLSSYLEQLR